MRAYYSRNIINQLMLLTIRKLLVDSLGVWEFGSSGEPVSQSRLLRHRIAKLTKVSYRDLAPARPRQPNRHCAYVLQLLYKTSLIKRTFLSLFVFS